ncbi:MAG: TonB-dependent receptor [Flavobacteriales bacterium]|nr:TonB-dependent receptor [Flavobacteriales bacterium]
MNLYLKYLIFFLGIIEGINAQSKVTVSGFIKDAQTGEPLIGANIISINNQQSGVITNEFGFYSITLPSGKLQLLVQYLGYTPNKLDTFLQTNFQWDVMLHPSSKALSEIHITDSISAYTFLSSLSGVEKIDLQQMNKLPVLVGERDFIKSMQLLPGVQAANEGSSGYHIRGGAADQNLIVLDDATVYNPSHLLGFFSSFNSDAVKEATLYKGNAPSQYGGRISSVLDVRMNEGDNQQFHLGGGVSLIAARLMAEGPIEKGKSSYLVSGRRTYADLFTRISSNTSIKNTVLYFYDINAKLNFNLGKKSRLLVSGYYGQDELMLSDFQLWWYNALATIRFQQLIRSNVFSNTSFVFSDYSSTVTVSTDSVGIKLRSEIMDFQLKQDFQIYPSYKHTLRAGIISTVHIVTPGEIDGTGATGFNMTDLSKRYSWENALYINHEWATLHWMKIHSGLRLVNFNATGPGDFYVKNNSGEISDTLHYNSFSFPASYVNIEPRLFFNFHPFRYTSIKIGYARHTQFLHLLANSFASNPTDKWVPSSNLVRPEISDQVSLGLFQQVHQQMFEISLEGYYKHLQNQLDYKNGADVLNNELYEADLLTGNGRAYGMEFCFRKNKEKFTGWIAYTLSRTERRFQGINDFNWYPARQDRTHNVNIVLAYNWKRFTFTGVFVYYTGNAVTFPSGKYEIDGKIVYVFTERNGYRMPDYHRLDLGVAIDLRSNKKRVNKKGLPKRKMIVSELTFGAYNVYNRHNTYRITFRESKTEPGKTEAVSTALFGIVPYVGYNFKF